MTILCLEAGIHYVYNDYGIMTPHLAFTKLSTVTLFTSCVHIEHSVQSTLCHCACSESELAFPSNLVICDCSSPSSSNSSSSSSSSWLLPSLSSLDNTVELMSDESIEIMTKHMRKNENWDYNRALERVYSIMYHIKYEVFIKMRKHPYNFNVTKQWEK